MSCFYESKFRKTTIVYDKDFGLAYDIEKVFQSPVKRITNSTDKTRASPDNNSSYCCACQELVGGRLYTCSRCSSSFHSICHFPPLPIYSGRIERSKKWVCHRCQIELSNNLELLGKQFPDIQQKEDAYNRSLVRFMLQKDDDGKNEEPRQLIDFMNALRSINAREFSLDKLNVDESYYKLPFDEVFNKAEQQGRKPCFNCHKFVEKQTIICDYCNAVFCFNCLNPPIAAPKNERFMCPLHVEHFVDQHFVSSLRVTERIALWKEHTNLPSKDNFLIFKDFYNKCKSESLGQEQSLNSERGKHPAGNGLVMRNWKGKNSSDRPKFKVNKFVKEAYARIYAANKAKQEEIAKGTNNCMEASTSDEALNCQPRQMSPSAAANLLINLRNQRTISLGEVVASSSNTEASGISFYKPFFNSTLPVYGALYVVSGKDRVEGDILLPIQSQFVTLGLCSNNKHSIDLSKLSSCKEFANQQALIFFDKSKFAFEMISNNLFMDDTGISANHAKFDCKCLKPPEVDPLLDQLDISDGISPSMRSAVLWNGAIIRIGCLRLLFVSLANL